MGVKKMNISVIVVTYQRLALLTNCLLGIDAQTQMPWEVVVVCQDSDQPTLAFVTHWQQQPSPYQKRVQVVDSAHRVDAYQKCISLLSGDVTAFIEDDTEPSPDWLAQLSRHYQHPMVGGVGGRDWIRQFAADGPEPVVGRLTWYGRLIMHHHLGFGPARTVDVLKSANMSFRTELIQFPEFTHGQAVQAHFEVFICLRIRRLGYRLIYDPNASVCHHSILPASTSEQLALEQEALADAAFNLFVSTYLYSPLLLLPLQCIYHVLVGDRYTPGLLRALVGLLVGDVFSLHAVRATQLGHVQALIYYLRHLQTLQQQVEVEPEYGRELQFAHGENP